MKEFFATYSLTDIIIFVVGLAAVYKGFVTFFDWLKSKRRKDALEEMKPEELEKGLKKETLDRELQIKELEVKREQELTSFREQFAGIQDQVSALNKKVDLLINSDKDDIKSYITREYHYFIDRGWIDDYSMDCLEKRYSHYVQEDGNSFVAELMSQLRNLPRNSYKD